jgi:hypothetical protein
MGKGDFFNPPHSPFFFFLGGGWDFLRDIFLLGTRDMHMSVVSVSVKMSSVMSVIDDACLQGLHR